MFVKSHPFCLKMLLFVWVTCRWSSLVAVDCCCEWLSLTVSLGALIRNGMRNFCYCFLFLAYYFYEFSWICCWNNLWDFALRPSCQSCLRCCWIKIRCEVWIFMSSILWRINCYLFHLRFLRNVAFRLSCEYSH